MTARIMPPLDSETSSPLRVAFRTIGCKLNQCETAQMQESFLAEGYSLVDWEETADVRVINTCTVTAKSDSTCRRQIRLAKRLDPHCIVAVTGCYAEIDPDAIEAIPGVDLVIGNDDKPRMTEYVRAVQASPGLPAVAHAVGRRSPMTHGADQAAAGEFITHFHGYTRAFLKIQNGCDSRCAYCIIPAARGPARSMPTDQVVQQVRQLIARDYREVVLTGINLGSWGRDLGQGGLAELLRMLVANTDAVRYRLSSIEPMEIEGPVLDAVEDGGPRMAHHFHLPLQSGSDDVLRRMKRPYLTEDYLRVSGEIARRFPEAAIGADVIVGFPGETDDEFAQTCRLVETSPLTYLHVFAYSDRPGTVASGMRDKIRPETIHERSVMLREIGRSLRTRFQARIEGSRQRVLILRERVADGRLRGVSGNYAEALVDGEDGLMNRFVHGTLRGPVIEGRWSLDDVVPEDPAE